MEMPHEKPVNHGPPPGDDADETNMAWTGEKRRRKYLPQSPSSSDAPTKKLPLGGVPLDRMTPQMSWTERLKVWASHARCRVAYYKIVKPESGCELKGPYEYTEDELRKKRYFKYLEDDVGFEWFFSTDDIWNPDLDDYQKMSLKDIMPGRIESEYLNADEYHDRYHTYEMDAVYVKYYGEISKKIKWIEKFVHLDERSVEWSVMDTTGWRQALRIATNFPHMTLRLASFAYGEYISELRKDAALKDLDLVYFEIWRLVVKDNKSHMDAVKLVHEMEKFHMHKRTMEAELTGAPVFVTLKHRIYAVILEGDIVANTEDNKARDLFRKGFARLKTKNMVKYAEKKMKIAELLNLHKRVAEDLMNRFLKGSGRCLKATSNLPSLSRN